MLDLERTTISVMLVLDFGSPFPEPAISFCTFVAPLRKRHLKHKPDKTEALRAHTTERIRQALHTGSIESQNFYRRFFRDDSDISSCSSLSEDDLHLEGRAPP